MVTTSSEPRFCRICNSQLTDENWRPGQRKRGSRICGPCDTQCARERRKERTTEFVEGHECRVCQAPLEEHNWQPSSRAALDYTCRDCARQREREAQNTKPRSHHGFVYALRGEVSQGWIHVGRAVDLNKRLGTYKSYLGEKTSLIHAVSTKDTFDLERRVLVLLRAFVGEGEAYRESFLVSSREVITILDQAKAEQDVARKARAAFLWDQHRQYWEAKHQETLAVAAE